MTINEGYVFDPESGPEMTRLIEQDRFTTRSMGGVFPGIPLSTVENLHAVLDIACGPGGWVLDVAFAYPEVEVAGIDISRNMIAYAAARARSQGLKNTSFGVMDITKPLDLSDASFDLVNARFLFGVLKREQWSAFLAECTRVLRPGGILRLTEPIDIGITSSLAHRRFTHLFVQALWLAGYGLSPEKESLNSSFIFPRLLRQSGYQGVRYQPHALEVSTDTDGWAENYHNYRVAYYAAKPLLTAMGVASQDEVEDLYQQMIIEMNQENFSGVSHFATVWATKER